MPVSCARPNSFSPENMPSIEATSYLPFGLGPRMCVATVLAQTEIALIIAMLLRTYRLELPPEELASVSPELVHSLLTYSITHKIKKELVLLRRPNMLGFGESLLPRVPNCRPATHRISGSY
ncbi:hypothetical protein HPB48_012904 [Haemaphysalis longicornis]|uniref:Cytochrome P450 n=1 Tax=Haemaphysalis longicornis TaxID=44386 RepID=A0A9J6FRG8_HAELO|nr:hypothetical protein HPB48_012904 [Haemaphysalis longicornis]